VRGPNGFAAGQQLGGNHLAIGNEWQRQITIPPLEEMDVGGFSVAGGAAPSGGFPRVTAWGSP
ncbi:MAG: hypothetical protein WCS43_19225, partial [Verrucomicrobiota bacterium]